MNKKTTSLLLCTMLMGTLATGCGTQEGQQKATPPDQGDQQKQASAPLKGPVIPPDAKPETASFIDPTASITGSEYLTLGSKVYIAPFAKIITTKDTALTIGEESDLQDNTVIDASQSPIALGERAVIAHGGQLISTKKGQAATMGADTKKPEYSNPGVQAIQGYLDKHPGHAEWGKLPTFIGFNSIVDGATMSDGSMVTHLCKVGPGIILKSGMKVLPGKEINTQAEADDPKLGKVGYVTYDDMAFMLGVVHVNVNLARGYTELYHAKPENVLGINWDPGTVQHNMEQHLPTVGGKPTQQPDTGTHKFRIIGDVRITDIAGVKDEVSLRADEGPTFEIGAANQFQGGNTLHALEGSNIKMDDNVIVDPKAIVHGGSDSILEQGILTKIGANSRIGAGAVVFKSKLGKNVQVGSRALVMGSHVPDNTVIPPNAIWVGGKQTGKVEW